MEGDAKATRGRDGAKLFPSWSSTALPSQGSQAGGRWSSPDGRTGSTGSDTAQSPHFPYAQRMDARHKDGFGVVGLGARSGIAPMGIAPMGITPSPAASHTGGTAGDGGEAAGGARGDGELR